MTSAQTMLADMIDNRPDLPLMPADWRLIKAALRAGSAPAAVRESIIRGLAEFFSESVHLVWSSDEIASCLTDMIDKATPEEASTAVRDREAIARIIDPIPFTALERSYLVPTNEEFTRMREAREKADAILALATPEEAFTAAGATLRPITGNEYLAEIKRLDGLPSTAAGEATFTNEAIAIRMRQTYEVTGDKWFKLAADALAAPPAAQTDDDERLYRIRNLIASYMACETDCQKMPSGCGCALTAARAVVAHCPQVTEGARHER